MPLSQKCAAVTNSAIPYHPCLHPEAHHTVARLHLPVAPGCNTRCGYCDREASPRTAFIRAPGLSTTILTPKQALAKTRDFLSRWGSNAVVGVAGPGEPLANDETLQTLSLVRREFPNLVLCLCTNGLNLPDQCEDLHDLGVQHLSITINGFDPSVVAQIQPVVSKDGRVYEGYRAAELLIQNQKAGLEAAVESGMVVKINCVVVPDINGDSVISTARQVKALGAHVFNPVPLIPRGLFRRMNRPDNYYMTRLRSLCSGIIPVFHHCKQCRADAEGIPGKEDAR